MIKAIRSSKTMADERAVIAKESAFIRTSFKADNADTRYINVQKLLYIYMLGHPAHFGQMECLKLVASPRFMDKRLGYLGIMLLLDENQELLTLRHEERKHSDNRYALCTLGNISSVEMARDLANDVEKLLASGNSFVRKKAALCAMRLIKKVPDLTENYQASLISLLQDKHHGVLLTIITLLIEMCHQNQNVTEELRNLIFLRCSVPVLVRHLKNLTTPGFSPEHDVSGITDPFLQIKILRLLRILRNGSNFASDAMNDILAQVATNTDGSKNVGNAILYETVLTILNIESENSLRVLAVNILGRFLSNKDNNIRYVALTTLTKPSQTTLTADLSALQRHRATILDYLSFFLINSSNIRILTRELLSFLEVAEIDIKSSVASRIVDFAGRFRPNKRWEIDTTIRVMRAAGASVDGATWNHCVKVVTTSPKDLQLYAVRKLYNLLRLEGDLALAQEGLVLVTVWCVGEFGDVLVRGGDSGGGAVDEDEAGAATDYMSAPSERDVALQLDSLLKGLFATLLVKDFVRSLLVKFQTNIDVEIQARAVEYTAITKLDKETRAALLESMPVLESAVKEEARKANTRPGRSAPSASKSGNILDFGDDSIPAPASVPGLGGSAGNDLLDLVFGGIPAAAAAAPMPSFGSVAGNNNFMDLLGGLSMTSTPVPASMPPMGMGMGMPMGASMQTSLFPQNAVQAPKPSNDLLGDLFGSGTSQPVAPIVPVMGMGGAASDPFGSLLSGPSIMASSPIVVQPKSVPFYEKNGFRIGLTASLKLTMQLPSATVIPTAGSATQSMRIDNPSKAAIKLRIKLSYVAPSLLGGAPQPVNEIVDFAGFDSSLWA
ncbi:adaptin N terminal region-domain-containing protein [Chytriomyces sp. MP71]|nr:adaptin N terminal region-domain-containing protein [Chytriomyces sp. MP71]